MRYLFPFFLLLILAACKRPESLSGTRWASRFDRYYNVYVFETDSTGYWREGSFSPGSTQPALGEQNPFRYQLTPYELTIEHQLILDKRVFNRKGKNDNTRFVSIYEYTFGREVLVREK